MMTVKRLLEDNTSVLTLLAGQMSNCRLITWAHTVDLPDPWRWVSPGNLLMTTGTGLPLQPEEQILWIEKLASSNPSALLIAARPDAPRPSKAMLMA